MASMIRDEAGETARRGARAPIEPARLAAFKMLLERDHAGSLSQLIRTEIVPRLVVAHATDGDVGDGIASSSVGTENDVEALAALALEGEAGALLARVDDFVARGVSADAVLVDLLAPTARLLGEYWESDRCDFLDVTMALWRLQEVIHDLAARVPAERSAGRSAPCALFSPMPGEQHGFGTVVIDEVFRRDGWLTYRLGDPDTAELIRHAAGDWYDLIGLTVSCDCHIGDLPPLIAALRNVSRNPQVCVMVGGRVFGSDPELVARVGADGTAPDARAALRLASTLVRSRKREALVCN